MIIKLDITSVHLDYCNMKQILLSKGQVALVDDEDFERLNQHKWCVVKPRRKYYAMRNITLAGKSRCIYLHREVLQPRAGMVVDHIDGDGLNNQKGNLRECTTRENSLNRCRQRDNKSGFKGVSYAQKSATMISERNKPWLACIHIPFQTGRVKVHLGYYCSKDEAARAYDEAAKKHFGEFAFLNFPEELS